MLKVSQPGMDSYLPTDTITGKEPLDKSEPKSSEAAVSQEVAQQSILQTSSKDRIKAKLL